MDRRQVISRTRRLLVGVLLAAPFYWLLIDTVDTPELVAGAVAAAIAACVYELSQTRGVSDPTFRLSSVRELLSALAQVPGGVAIVTVEVFAQALRPRAQRGRLEVKPFAADDGGPEGLGRRALTEALGSLAPHSFVIGIDPDRQELLVHRLR